MRYYEATLLLSPQIAKDQADSLWHSLSQELEQAGFRIEKEIKPIERSLGYPLKKGSHVRRAYMGSFSLSLDGDIGKQLSLASQILKNQAEVLRWMITRLARIPEATGKTVRRMYRKKRETLEPTLKPKNQLKGQKPSLDELEKKLEEILEDKISF